MDINKLIQDHNTFTLQTRLNHITVTKFDTGFHAAIRWTIGDNRKDERYVSEDHVFEWVKNNHKSIRFA